MTGTKKSILDHLAPSDWVTLVAIAVQAAVILWRVGVLEDQVKVLDGRLWDHMAKPAAAASLCPPDAARWTGFTLARAP